MTVSGIALDSRIDKLTELFYCDFARNMPVKYKSVKSELI